MANNFNASSSSQPGLGLYSKGDSMSDGFYMGQNPLHERRRRLTSSQLLASRPTTEAHQTQLTHQGDHHHNPSFALSLGPTFGQLGLSRGVTGVMRRSCATPYPKMLQIHRIVDISPSQSQLSLFPVAHEISVTEVIRTTKFLAPASTLDRLSSANHVVHQGRIGLENIRVGNETRQQPHWANLPNQTSSNHVNYPSINSYQYYVARYHHHLNSSQSPTTLNAIMNMNRGYYANGDKTRTQFLNPQPAVSTLVPRDTPNIPGQNQDLLRNSENDEGESVGDGRTHSLPHPKHGPYTCPKCRNVFQTSQTFAAHVPSHHYKHESLEERKKRLAAKYRKKKKENLRLVRSRSGLTLLPQRIALKMLAIQQNSGVKVEIEDHDGEGQVQVQAGGGRSTSGLRNNFTSDRQIKEEAM